MTHRHFHVRHSLRATEAEARLTHFADFETRSEREAAVQLDLARERAERLERTGSVSDRLNNNRLNAYLIDEDYAADLLDAERRALLLGDTVESRKYLGALQKIQKIERIYAEQGKVAGLKFGAPGEGFTLIAADENFVEMAITFIAAQKKENIAPMADPAADRPYDPASETIDEYNRAMARQRQRNVELSKNARRWGDAENEQWGMVLNALRTYQSTFEKTKQVKKEVSINPRRILDLNDAWKRQNPFEYRQMLRDAAKKDAFVLMGKEERREFSPGALAQLIDEAKGENPQVLLYLPKSEKEKNVGGYRDDMLEGAKKDGSLIFWAAKEYDTYWKDVPAQYTQLCVNSITQQPALFFRNADWLKPNTAPALHGIEKALSGATKVKIVAMLSIYGIEALERLEGRYAGLIDRLLESGDATVVLETVRAVARDPKLFDALKRHNNDVYTKILAQLAASNADMREARTKSDIVMDDEDFAEAILQELLKLVEAKEKNFNAIREGKLDLTRIPEHVWETGAYKQLFIDIFSAHGELFAYAPDWMRGKHEYALPIIIQSASAYGHALENVRNDPQVLYAALLAEKNKQGNMHWRDVPRELRMRLDAIGFTGMVDKDTPADPEKLLRVLILGLKEKSQALTPEQVHSFMDSWDGDMRKDKELVSAYLDRALGVHPEYYLDADEALRNEFFFARKMVGINTKVLTFITADQHKEFDLSNREDYRAMVADAVRYDPNLLDGFPKTLLNQADFITDLIKMSGRPELLRFAPESVRSDIPFLVSVLQGMVNKGAPLATLREFFGILPEDTAIKVLLDQNGALVLKLLELNIGAEALVPPMVLRGVLLHRIVQQFKNAGNRDRMTGVLLRATPTARYDYFDEHPEEILYLFEQTPTKIASVVPTSLLTVDLIATLAEGYTDDANRALFYELINLKPMVLVGLLRRRNELWDVLDTNMQERMIGRLDNATLILLREGKEAREKERKQRDISRALDDLRVCRQEAHYLMGMDPKLAKVSIRWTDGKYYPAQHLFQWLDNKQAPEIIAKAQRGEASPADIYEEVGRFRSLIQVLRVSVNPVSADANALKAPLNESINADGIGVGEKTGAASARIVVLRALMQAQQGKRLPRDPAEREKAEAFLKSAKDEYTSNLRGLIEKLSQTTLRNFSADQLRNYLRNVDAIYHAVYDQYKSSTDPLDKQLLQNWIVEILELKSQAQQELRRVTELPNVRDSESLYNLDGASLKFVDAVAKELKVDRVKFAKALEAQGTRNAYYVSEQYLRRLQTPAQWNAVDKVAIAFGETSESFAQKIESGDIGFLTQCVLLSQEKHAPAIIDAIRKDVTFPIGLNGEPGTLDITKDRSMIIMASREMGSTFSMDRLKKTWTSIRERQHDQFTSSPDILQGPPVAAKKIDVFVIAEDDGLEGAGRQAIARSTDLTKALNRQQLPGTEGTTTAHLVVDRQQFDARLQEFIGLASEAKYQSGGRHLVLRVMTHGSPRTNALHIDPGEIASQMDPRSGTLLYTSCSGGSQLTKMFGDTLKNSEVNVLTEASDTITPLHTDDMIDAKIEGAYEKDANGKFVADFNGDGVVSLPEAFHWLDRNSSFQDPQGFGPKGQQFTGTKKGKSVEGLA